MRRIGLLLVAAVLGACSSPPITVDVPPVQHLMPVVGATNGPIGLAAMANTGTCWILRDDSPHPHRAAHGGADAPPAEHHIRAMVARPGWAERKTPRSEQVTAHTCDA